MSPAGRRISMLAVAASLAGACTPTVSTMKQYRHDAPATARLAHDAAAICHCLRVTGEFPPRAFTTDGCSASPDRDWGDCCVEHDIAYWCGGSKEDRRAADRRLVACVEAKGHSKSWANFMRLVVGAGGQPQSPMPWRWAYGWSGIRGYEKRSGPENPDSCFAPPSLDISGAAADSFAQ